MTTESMKPYPAYKDSGIEWIGEIPEGWDTIQIKRLSQIKRGASPRPIEDQKYFDDDGDFAWVRIADVSASDKYLENTTQTLSELGASHSVKRYPGDMFLSIAGTVGKPIITKIKCCIHDGFVWFPNLKIKPEFLYYIFLAGEAYNGLGKMGTQLNLNTETVGSIPIPLPPSEQDILKIIHFLENQTAKIDTLIENKQRQIELLKEERTAIINQAVTKGLNPDVPMRDSGIEWLGEIPEHWDVAKSKYFSEIVLGKMLTPNDKGNYHKKRYLRAKNILWENVDVSDVKCMWFSDNELIQYRLHLNDLIVSEGGEVGRTAIWKNELEECYIQNSVYKVTIGELHNSNYFLYQFILYGKMGHFDSIVNRVSIAHLTREKLKEVSFIAPPRSEQQSIVTFLNHQTAKIDTDIKIVQNQITLLKEYRTALISDAVTGKIDLRNEQHIPTSK